MAGTAGVRAIHRAFGPESERTRGSPRLPSPRRALISTPGFRSASTADQIILPMALGEGGEFRTVAPSLHTTHAEFIRAFLDVAITIEAESDRVSRVTVRGAGLGGLAG